MIVDSQICLLLQHKSSKETVWLLSFWAGNRTERKSVMAFIATRQRQQLLLFIHNHLSDLVTFQKTVIITFTRMRTSNLLTHVLGVCLCCIEPQIQQLCLFASWHATWGELVCALTSYGFCFHLCPELFARYSPVIRPFRYLCDSYVIIFGFYNMQSL